MSPQCLVHARPSIRCCPQQCRVPPRRRWLRPKVSGACRWHPGVLCGLQTSEEELMAMTGPPDLVYDLVREVSPFRWRFLTWFDDIVVRSLQVFFVHSSAGVFDHFSFAFFQLVDGVVEFLQRARRRRVLWLVVTDLVVVCNRRLCVKRLGQLREHALSVELVGASLCIACVMKTFLRLVLMEVVFWGPRTLHQNVCDVFSSFVVFERT